MNGAWDYGLSCLQENLSRGLGIVSSAVAARTTYPVMQNVLITTDNARLKLAATNQEIAISTWIGAQIEEEGEVTIPARLLTEFVNSLRPSVSTSITPNSPSAYP